MSLDQLKAFLAKMQTDESLKRQVLAAADRSIGRTANTSPRQTASLNRIPDKSISSRILITYVYRESA